MYHEHVNNCTVVCSLSLSRTVCRIWWMVRTYDADGWTDGPDWSNVKRLVANIFDRREIRHVVYHKKQSTLEMTEYFVAFTIITPF